MQRFGHLRRPREIKSAAGQLKRAALRIEIGIGIEARKIEFARGQVQSKPTQRQTAAIITRRGQRALPLQREGFQPPLHLRSSPAFGLRQPHEIRRQSSQIKLFDFQAVANRRALVNKGDIARDFAGCALQAAQIDIELIPRPTATPIETGVERRQNQFALALLQR